MVSSVYRWNFSPISNSMRKKRGSLINSIIDETMRVCSVTLCGRRRWYKCWVKTIIVPWIILLIYICVSIFQSEESIARTTSTSFITKSSQSTIIRSIINFLVKMKSVSFIFPRTSLFDFEYNRPASTNV